jgi:hypothetical protein
MPISCKIERDRIYDEGAVVLSLDLPSSTLAKARRAGDLRFAKKGRRILYLGRWVLEWLTGDEEVPHGKL